MRLCQARLKTFEYELNKLRRRCDACFWGARLFAPSRAPALSITVTLSFTFALG